MTALPFFLGHLRFSATCHATGYPSRVPHLADSGWLPYSCGGRLAWGWGCLGTDVLIPHLVFYLVPVQLPLPLLPLWGSAPLAGASACLSPVCWSTPGVGLVGSRVATRKKQACFFRKKTVFFAKKTQPEKNRPKFCFFPF